MPTQVFVQIDGVVNHRHHGIKGGHDPATEHRLASLHDDQDADHPTNYAFLTTKERSQYRRTLAGESFYYIYDRAKKENPQRSLPALRREAAKRRLKAFR